MASTTISLAWKPVHSDIGVKKKNEMAQNNVQGMPPAYGPPPVVTVQPGVVYQGNVVPVVIGNQMGFQPSVINCPSCRQQIVTRVELKSSTKTHLFAVLLCIVFLPCVILPYCLDSCHNADHYCPNCNAYIGSYIH